MRAFALLSVVLFHLDISTSGYTIFASGFLGVDVFFVISGFLITKSLMKQKDDFGELSLIHFYQKRIRRIVPLLLLVCSVTSVFAYFYMPPLELVVFAKSQIASLFFFSNYYWYFSAQDYWNSSMELAPLIHTWSLSIEEQFYLLYPLGLLLIFKLDRKKQVATILAAATALIFWRTIFAEMNTLQAFYLFQSRAWELGAGAAAAFFQRDCGAGASRARSVTGKVCGLLFFICLFVIPKGIVDDYRLHVAATVVLSSFCLLVSSDQPSFFNRFMGLRFITQLGERSYSGYLWHVPVFSFFTLSGSFSGFLDKGMAVLATAFLSALSFRYLEEPLNHKKTLSRTGYVAVLFTGIVLVGFSARILQTSGLPKREGLYGKRTKLDYKMDYDIRRKLVYDLPHLGGAKMKNGSVVIIGDSYASGLSVGLDKNRLEGVVVAPGTGHWCLAVVLPGWVPDYLSRTQADEICQKSRKTIFQSHDYSQVAAVFFADRHSFHQMDNPLVQGTLRELLEDLKNQGFRGKAYVMGIRPEFKVSPVNLFWGKGVSGIDHYKQAEEFMILPLEEMQRLDFQLKSFYESKGIGYFSVLDQLCKGGECKLFEGEVSIYMDKNHFTIEGSKIVTELLAIELEKHQKEFLQKAK